MTIGFVLLLLLGADPAPSRCTCRSIDWQAEDFAARADLIVLAVPVEERLFVEPAPGRAAPAPGGWAGQRFLIETDLLVLEYLKGDGDRYLTLSHEFWDLDNCGIAFSVGAPDLILAERSATGGYTTSACWHPAISRHGVTDDQVIEAAGAGRQE